MSKSKIYKLKRAHLRVRKKISGTPHLLRLAVHKSNKNIIAQLINDQNGETVFYASSMEESFKKENVSIGSNVKAAEIVGKLIAEKALSKNISKVVFDRGGHLYHGRIKALAEAARSAGLDF